MIDAPATLVEMRHLVARALAIADAMDDAHLAAHLDTAYQIIVGRMPSPRAVQGHAE